MTRTNRPERVKTFWLFPIVGVALAVIGFLLWIVLGNVADDLLAVLWRGAWVILIVPVIGLIGMRILSDLFSSPAAENNQNASSGTHRTSHVYAVRAILFLFAVGLPMLLMRSDLIGGDLNSAASNFWSAGWLTVRYLVAALILIGIAAANFREVSHPPAFAFGWVLAVTIITYDWIMTAQPGWVSSGLPIMVAGFALLSGCAIRAALTQRATDLQRWKRLLVVFALVAAFLALAHQLVVWSGDRPVSTIWYVTRLTDGWVWFQLAGILLMPAALAILFLDYLYNPKGNSETLLAPLHAAAGLLVISVVIQTAWWVLPGHANLVFGILFSAIMIGVLNLFIRAAVIDGAEVGEVSHD